MPPLLRWLTLPECGSQTAAEKWKRAGTLSSPSPFRTPPPPAVVPNGVVTRALNKAASRIRKDIRHAGEGVSEGVQKPNKNAASEALMGSSWHIYEGSNENERTEKPY